MSYEHSRILLHFILISSVIQLAFASQAVLAQNQTTQVPVSLGLISRDDDSLYVQVVFDLVLQEVSDKVNMSFGYVKECVLTICGVVHESHEKAHLSIWPDDEQYGVRCSSDWLDCAGDIQQLCVHKYASQKQWWNFVMCQNQEGKDEIGRSGAARKCAIVAKIPWEIIGDCVGPDANGIDAEGAQLLLQNVKDTVEQGVG